MRLWHQQLLPYLPRQQLLGQHRECAALRGNGWGRRHSVVNYVFDHPPALLVSYHLLVMAEMERRGYHPDPIWKNPNWRGSSLGEISWIKDFSPSDCTPIYPEHNDKYLQECLENLKNKNIVINFDSPVSR